MSINQTTLQELDSRIRTLRKQTQGLQGAVLEKSDPEKFSQLLLELDSAMREHYMLLYGEQVSMP